MWKIFAALALGVVFGSKKLLPQAFYKFTAYLTWLGLVILLFFMGLLLGSHEEVLSHLDTLGLKALLLALASVAGSLLTVRLLDCTLFLPEKLPEDKKA